MPPTYDWSCGEHAYEIVTTVAERDTQTTCPTCGKAGARQLTLPRLSNTAGDWNRVEFNHGLGCWTKGHRDAAQKAKARGLVEVGNESPETIHKTQEAVHKANREAVWSDVARDKLYE